MEIRGTAGLLLDAMSIRTRIMEIRGTVDLLLGLMSTRTRILGILGIAVLFCAVRVSLRPEPSGLQSQAPGQPSILDELEEVLVDLRRTWQPRARERLLEDARQQISRWSPPLLWLLSQPKHPLLPEALDLVQELEIAECRFHVLMLVQEGPQSARPKALVVAHRLEPLLGHELTPFLEDRDPEMVVAALQCAATASEVRLEAIIQLVVHPDVRVCEAALDVIPEQLAEEDLDHLLDLARTASGPSAVFTIRALGRAEIVDRSEAFLNGALSSWEPEIRTSALEALAGKDGPLSDPGPVWAMATDPALDLHDRARAFLCLEKTGSSSPDALRDELYGMHPFLKYFAARCLITAGDAKGMEILVDLDSNPWQFNGEETQEIEQIRGSTRKLIFQLSGIRESAAVPASEWKSVLRGPLATPLPPPPVVDLPDSR